MSDAWFYGGIRSVGRWVCVLDELGEPRVCYKVIGSRRRLRAALRHEYNDALIIVPLKYGEQGLQFEIRHRLGRGPEPRKSGIRS